MLKSLGTVLFAAASVCVSGCGGGPGFDICEVEGIVTINGEPTEKLRVEFWPTGEVGPKSAATTDDQGRFALRTWDGETKGAVVGVHKVVVHDITLMKVPFAGFANMNVDTTQGAQPRMADKYTNFSVTPIEVEITGETRDLKVNLDPYSRPRGR